MRVREAFRIGGIMLALVLGFVPPALGQDTATARVMELNRSGQWSRAADLAEQLLSSDRSSSGLERCELIYGLAYARTRLREAAAARDAIASFDQECADVPAASWISRETARLREENAGTLPIAANDSFWKVADAASLGLDVAAVDEHARLCERTGADACLLVFRGTIVQEWYAPRYQEPMYAMSTTKSITGLLFGMLLDDGRIRGPDERVCTYIAQWCDGLRGRVTLRHLLSMTSGLPRVRDQGVGFVADKNPYVIGLEPATEPGTAWAYSNEGTQLLSPILDAAAGEPIQDYAEKRLFEPLGMRHTRLHLDTKGHAWTYADMETTPRDLARIGLLLLNDGAWDGRRIVSREWITASTSPSQALNAQYGLLWWLHAEPRGFAGHGHLDTHLHVFPHIELIAVRMQNRLFERSAEGAYEREALPLFQRMVR